jgi:LytS/YehU family sensor histidine kinase
MVLNNIHYLGSTAYEVLEWVIYFVLTFGLIIANVFILVPHYLLKNRVVAYFVAAFVIIVIGLILIVYLQIFVFSGGTLIEKMGGTVIIVNCLSSLVSMGFLVTGSSAIQLLRYWIKDTRRIGELEAATLQSELDLLKSQINPHFLFNMLNNANVLIWKNKEEAQQLLYKLESLLKYQLKEATSDKILLLFDIRFLNDFLNLEKVRRDNFEFTITTEGNANEIWMPSLLFIPFVENAIKHNPDSNHLSYVYIHFKIAGRKLEFRCENSKPATKPVQKQSGGLGLKNIQRRLSLLYPGKHILDIQDEATRYTITLKLELE